MAKGAYSFHFRHRSSVPGSDVRVEGRRLGKRLRAEPKAVKEHAPHLPRAPTGRFSALCTPRPVGLSRAERCWRSMIEMRRNCSGWADTPCCHWCTCNTREMSEAWKEACMAAGSIGHGRRHTRHAAPHPKPRHARRTRSRWQTAHTLLISVILAVFQAPMFALNAVAPLNACEPSHTLSKSPRRISPEPRRGRSSAWRALASSGPSACGSRCWRSTIEMRCPCDGGG